MAESEGREPFFRLPWPVLAILASIVLPRALQSLIGDPDWIYAEFGLSPADLVAGRWWGVATSLFVHGNWTHALLNAVGALAFAPPVARLFGEGVRGRAAFFGFYLVCGIVAAIGFCLVRLGQPGVLIGASGAISGLMGAASRLLEPAVTTAAETGRAGEGPWGEPAGVTPGWRPPIVLAPFRSRTVIGMAGAWIAINLLMGVAGVPLIAAGAPVAWEAHLFGYAAGLFLIGPSAALFRRR